MYDIDFSILCLFLATCVIIGIKSSKRISNLRQFALGYKSLTTTALFCSLISSAIGTGATLGVAEKTYMFGIMILIWQISKPVSWYIKSLIIPNGIKYVKQCMTIGDVMHKFYGPVGRYMVSTLSILANIMGMMVQGLAMGHMLNYFLGIDPMYGMMVGYGVLITYSMLGGINAVVQTEIFKSIFFFVIIPISYVFATVKSGGFGNLITTLPEAYTKIELTSNNIINIIGLILYSIFPSYDAPLIQRCLMKPSKDKLKKCFSSIALLYIPFSISFCVIAYLVYVTKPSVQPSEVVFYYIEQLLPIGMKGIMIAGILAVMMSFSEAQLSSASIILIHDVIGCILGYKISPRNQLILARILILALGISAFYLIPNFSNSHLISIAWAAFNFYDPLISIPLTMAFLGMRSNQATFISNAIFAITFLIIGRFYAGEFAITSFCFGIIGSAIGFFGMHYLQRYSGVNFESKWDDVSLKLKVSIWYKRTMSELLKPQENIKYKEFTILILGLYYLFSLYICFVEYNSTLLIMLGIGYFMCLILIARNIIFRKKYIKFLTPYWHLVFIYCLPVVSSYILLIHGDSTFWIINGILLSFAVLFFTDAIKSAAYLILGTIITSTFLVKSDTSNHASLIGLSYILFFFVITTFTLLRKKECEHEEKIEKMQLYGGAMAHEVRSPLATLNMGAQQLRSILRDIKSSDSATEVENKISELDDIGELIKKVTDHGIYTVDSLLNTLNHKKISRSHNVRSDIGSIIINSVQSYYSFNQLTKPPAISIKSNFEIYGSRFLIRQVIENILNNAHKYGGQGVQVQIYTSCNKLYIKDDGYGISPKDLPYIFDKYYTKGYRSGTGIGLAFCKRVMEDLGGSIECRSKPNIHTTFILSFPRLH
jgi:Na+/proline symporter/signal transduction histidine kinase